MKIIAFTFMMLLSIIFVTTLLRGDKYASMADQPVTIDSVAIPTQPKQGKLPRETSCTVKNGHVQNETGHR